MFNLFGQDDFYNYKNLFKETKQKYFEIGKDEIKKIKEDYRKEDLENIFNDFKEFFNFFSDEKKEQKNPFKNIEEAKEKVLKTLQNLDCEFFKTQPYFRKVELKELINNKDPFILKSKSGFYYVKQKKNRLVFHGGENIFSTIYLNKENNILNICFSKSFKSLEEIFETFKLVYQRNLNKKERTNFDANLFLDNILTDLKFLDLIITQFNIKKDKKGINIKIKIKVNSESREKIVEEYVKDYLQNLNFKENISIIILKEIK